MSDRQNRIAKIQQCYRVLNVPTFSSAHTIKTAYRTLLRRWHPDLYPSTSPSYPEATRMTTLLNAAYERIKDAPLRYYAGDDARSTGGWRPAPGYSRQPAVDEYAGINAARIEFWVSFTFGAIAGPFIGWGLFINIPRTLEYFGSPAVMIGLTIVFMVASGFASVRYGDRFWCAIFGQWRSWS
jgi:hypothetical protein